LCQKEKAETMSDLYVNQLPAAPVSLLATDLLVMSRDGQNVLQVPYSQLAAAIGAIFYGGQGAFTTTTANFTQPAILATVSVPMVSTVWLAVGQFLFIASGGLYQVSSITDSTHAVLMNVGWGGNAVATTVIANGSRVGAGGPAGQPAYTLTTASFTMPAAAASVTVAVGNSSWMTPGATVYVGTAGYMTVASIVSGTSVSLTNTGSSGNAASASTVPTAQGVAPAGVQGPPGVLGASAACASLQTARNIDVTPFDGTANILVVAPATHAATSKATPVDADEMPLADSAASFVLKKLTWANLKAGMFAAWGALIAAGTVKGTPVGADAIAIADSAASNATKQVTLTGLAGFLAALAQTLTNKTLTNPTVTNYVETQYIASAGSAFTVDLTNGTLQQLPTNANTTITLPASVAGKSYVLVVAYGGAHTLTWLGGGVMKWANGVTPVPTSVNGKFDIYVFTCDGTNTFGRDGGRNF
jgi:hypothetical protein